MIARFVPGWEGGAEELAAAPCGTKMSGRFISLAALSR
jgi:hypothetical protein